MKKKSLGGLCTGLVLLGLAGTGQASSVFFDDFEDGDHAGWQITTPSGTGSTGVNTHNTSLMAYSTHTGTGSHALTYDFGYIGSDNLSFDMQAIANRANFGSQQVHANSGVIISFLDTFNISKGTVSFQNHTAGGTPLGVYDFLIDSNMHNYSGSFDLFANAAGIDTGIVGIDKLSISFFSAASRAGSAYSNATVHFDNVSVDTTSPVPLPAAAWLFGSGLLGLIGFSKRKKAA